MKEQLLIKVLEMLLASDGETKKDMSTPTNGIDSVHVGEYVLIRTYSAGVHFGRLVQREGKQALLDESRRIWSWDGAFTLSKVADCGVGSAKVSTKIDGFIVTEVIEIMRLSLAAKENLYGIADHG